MKNTNCPLCTDKLKSKKLNRLWNLIFCDNSDCYGFMERVRIECIHDYKYVYSTTETGRKVYGKECVHCGDYKRIRKDLVPNINNLTLRRAKYFVDVSRDMERFYLAQKGRYDQKRVKILEHHGEKASKEFVKLVDSMENMNATDFINNMYLFERSDFQWQIKESKKNEFDFEKDENGVHNEFQAMASIASSLHMGNRDDTNAIKRSFLIQNGIRPKNKGRFFGMF